ncbi:unnamed protein product, partial [Timema podura]|nr:unnamed protein product [Timema podura]
MKLHSFIAIFMSATVRISCSANDFLDCKTSPTSTIIDLKNAIFQSCKFDSSMRPIPSDGITTNVYFNIAVQFIDY